MLRVRTDTSGNFVSPYMKPGTYTMTRELSHPLALLQLTTFLVYQVELAIGSQSVTVSAGGTTTSNSKFQRG
jgi:rhamnogalacturonan endolyase